MSNITTPPARSRGPATYADRTALAKQILANSAAAVADALLPVADYYPNRAVVLNAQTVLANQSLNDVNLTFPTDGYLVAIRASTEDGASASLSGLLLRDPGQRKRGLFLIRIRQRRGLHLACAAHRQLRQVQPSPRVLPGERMVDFLHEHDRRGISWSTSLSTSSTRATRRTDGA